MSSPDSRSLIVNADDFGRSRGVNRGIATAHEHGVVTSASLMVRWPAALEAAEYGDTHPDLSLGLHVDLGEWEYRTDRWVTVYEFSQLHDRAAVEAEVRSQLAAFRRIVGDEPTHLDSHQHVHRDDSVVRSVLLELADELDVPLRHYASGVRFCGDFHGQTLKGAPWPEGISVEALISILAKLAPGLTELACHPGEADDLNTAYRTERATEVKVLCDPRVREALAAENINHRSFRDTNVRWPSV